jgi:chemotaxis protein MotB
MLFESGAIDLRPGALVFLDEIGRLLEVFPYQVAIEGHTDDDPIRSPLIPSNWHLSALRAIATLRYVEETSEVESHRLSAGGYGSTRPLAPNATPEGKAENRRVEFVFAR